MSSSGIRVAVGGIVHETNQYVASPTELADFTVTRGPEIFQRHAGRTYVGGMAAAAGELGLELVGTFHAIARPWGTITAGTYATLKAELLARLTAALPVEAIVLDLHGAAVAEGVDDVETDLLRDVRALVGDALPVAITLDLHGNLTQDTADLVDVMFGVQSYPHDDMFERGHEAVHALPRLLAKEWAPAIHVERLPLLLPTTTTYEGPGADVLALCQAVELQHGVIDCTFMHGFPYTDNPVVGASVVVTTNGDAVLAASLARDLAAQIWALRQRFLVTHPGPEEAIARALALPGRPIVINETSDNAGGGAPCDGTHLLRALLESATRDAVFVGIKDPEVVAQAAAAGVGATIEIELGGKTDDLHGKPISATAYVKLLTDGDTVIEAPMGRGSVYPLGPSARLVIDGLDVIVISNGMQSIDRTPAVLHGIDPRGRKLVALKSSQHFRSGYQELAAGIVTTDPPGLTTLRIEQLPRSRTSRPVFPLDATASYG